MQYNPLNPTRTGHTSDDLKSMARSIDQKYGASSVNINRPTHRPIYNLIRVFKSMIIYIYTLIYMMNQLKKHKCYVAMDQIHHNDVLRKSFCVI